MPTENIELTKEQIEVFERDRFERICQEEEKIIAELEQEEENDQ